MDAGYRDRFGNIAVMARVDDVINVAGHRLSTGQLEEVGDRTALQSQKTLSAYL